MIAFELWPKNWLPPPSFFCVCIILFILGHARNYSIAWARFDQTLVQYSCCWNKRRGALSSFKMGDQSIPGQDEDIFLGTNQINVFFINFFVSVLLDYRNKHYFCSLLFRFFLGSFVRKFLLPLGCRTFDGFIWFLAVLFSLTPYYVLACYCYFFSCFPAALPPLWLMTFGSDPRLVFCVSCRVLFRVAMTSFINAIAIVWNQ